VDGPAQLILIFFVSLYHLGHDAEASQFEQCRSGVGFGLRDVRPLLVGLAFAMLPQRLLNAGFVTGTGSPSRAPNIQRGRS
jgi:hypothetical protein